MTILKFDFRLTILFLMLKNNRQYVVLKVVETNNLLRLGSEAYYYPRRSVSSQRVNVTRTLAAAAKVSPISPQYCATWAEIQPTAPPPQTLGPVKKLGYLAQPASASSISI